MAKQKSMPPKASAPGLLDGLSPVVQDLLCVAALFVVILFLFHGIIFDNAAFSASSDTANSQSYAHVGKTIEQKEGQDAIWMPNFFGGMPTFGNVAYTPRDVSYLQSYGIRILNFLFLNGTWTPFVVYYFLGGVFMFMLGRVWGFNRIASLIAALTFMLSPYAIGLASEGHGSKLMALSYLPLAVMLTHLTLEKRSLLWFGLLACTIGTLMLTNHLQIVYYVFIIMGLYLLFQLIVDLKAEKRLIPVKTALFVGALLIGFCISAYVYLSVYEYADFSIRGGGTAGSTGGLAYDYATNWSWSIWESISLLIPGFYGLDGTPNPPYWGHVEPWTNAYVYVGLIPVILAVIALVYRRTKLTVLAAILTVLVILISLGRNFPVLFDAMFRFLPFFNKFRVPAVILHLLPFLFGTLAAGGFMAIEDLFKAQKTNARFIKTMMLLSGIAVGLFIVSLIFSAQIKDFLTGILFVKEGELAQFKHQYGARAKDALQYVQNMRLDVFWKDYIKFTLLCAVTFGAIVMYMRKAISSSLFSLILVALVVVDLMILDVRLVNPQPRQAVDESFTPDQTTTFLTHQTGQFRILPLGGSLFMDNTYAYNGLQSVGGYSPAKLKIYQTVLDSCLYNGPDRAFPLNMSIVDMLNAKYIVVQGRLPEDKFELVNADQAKKLLTYRNPSALARVWFVDSVVVLNHDTEIFAALNSAAFNPAKTAIVQSPAAVPVTGKPDSTASATVTEYQSRRIAIDATTLHPALLVVSEVYYPAGWKAFVDGKETEIYRTNSILRSVAVPAGTHKVEMVFDPPTYRAGLLTTNIAWAVAVLCVLIGLWREPSVRQWPGKKTSHAKS